MRREQVLGNPVTVSTLEEELILKLVAESKKDSHPINNGDLIFLAQQSRARKLEEGGQAVSELLDSIDAAIDKIQF